MSLSSKLSTTVDSIIQTFILKVSDKYKLDKKELNRLWSGTDVAELADVAEKVESKVKKVKKTEEHVESSSSSSTKVEPSKIDLDVLLKCNKAELVTLCKLHNLKCSGTKEQLVTILLKKDTISEDDKSVKSPKKTVKTTPKKSPKKPVSIIEKKIISNKPTLPIKRNKHGMFEHTETGLVFNNGSDIALGTQNEDGSIKQLTDNDITNCKQFKFDYILPDNLDANCKVKVKDIKEDEDEDDQEDEELVSEDELLDQNEITEDENYVSD